MGTPKWTAPLPYMGTHLLKEKLFPSSNTSKTTFQDDGERTALPLYTEAIKFFNHKDGMVRAAVRTLTLQMYGLEDEGIQQFLVSLPASNFFNEVAITIAEHCQASFSSRNATRTGICTWFDCINPEEKGFTKGHPVGRGMIWGSTQGLVGMPFVRAFNAVPQ